MNLPNDLPMIDFDKTELRVTATARIVRHREGLFAEFPLGQGLPPYYLVVLPDGRLLTVDVYCTFSSLEWSEPLPGISWSQFTDEMVERGAWVEFNPASVEEWRRVLDGAGGILQSAGPAFRIDDELLNALLDEALSATEA